MLRTLLVWWAEHLLALVPPSLRLRTGRRSNDLVVKVDGMAEAGAARLAILQQRGQSERVLARFAADEDGPPTARVALDRLKRPAGAVVRLPAGLLLEREVVLPLAAERDPASVLGYEMDRFTPFSAEEVFWDWETVRRDRSQNRLRLRLSLVPRSALESVLVALEALGIFPIAIETATSSGAIRRIPVARPTAPRTRLQRSVPVLAGATCAVLAVAVLVTPFLEQARRRQAVEAEIGTLRPQVAEVEALRQRIAGDTAGADVIAAERARLGDPLRVLATVTEILPDDTFLTDLQLRRGRLGISGQSAAAARLIPALAAEPSLRNPAFVAPVTRAEVGRADIFSITAELGAAP